MRDVSVVGGGSGYHGEKQGCLGVTRSAIAHGGQSEVAHVPNKSKQSFRDSCRPRRKGGLTGFSEYSTSLKARERKELQGTIHW